ncbi:MAG: MFS transporter [Candidatus Rokubacteria bacterium]|nr:MFS transporter [Candidatus Rokubacteria bacterium]MBI3105383.1 MFS transporter [Candidatus Rokubacteria bacterium]
MIPRPRDRIFYGWWIVAAGFGLEALIGALVFHAYGAYVVLLREEFGWSKTMLSAAFSMARMESGILGPIQGWLTDRFGPRALIRVGVVVFGLGFILFSQIASPLGFFVTFFLVALGSSLGGYLPISVAIVSWFRRRRALALGISATGMAVGGILTQLVALSLARHGWRWTAAGSGVVILLLGLPIAQLVRHRPELYGLHPDGDAPEAASAAAVSARSTGHGVAHASPAEFTPREAMRTPAFWLISLGHGSALLVVSAVLVHLVVHLTERLGYSLRQGTAVIAIMTAMQVLGQLGGGWAGDRFSKRTIIVVCMAGHAAALLLLASANAFWMVLGFAMLHGMAWGIRGPLMAAIRADYFGSGSFGMISGLSSMIVMLGMIGGPLIAGVLADRTGSYEAGFRVLAALAAAGSVFFILAWRPAPPRRSRPA